MKDDMPNRKQLRDTVIAASTDDERWSLWDQALKNPELSLTDTLIQENMEYLGWTKEQVMSCWGEKGTEKIKEKWMKEQPSDKQQIQNYYNSLRLYIPELSSWHAMEKNEDLLHIVEFLQQCMKSGLHSFLDYGAGIGSNGILFDYYNFDVTLADISDEMLSYQKWRLPRHQVNALYIDLKKTSLPRNAFDCATCIEVLEHTTNPVEIMDTIRTSLVIGGMVFVTTPFFEDAERPQHIVHSMAVTKEFELLGFDPIWVSPDGFYRFYKRVR